MKEGENPREREKECQGPEVTTKEKRRVKGKKENGKEFPFYFPLLLSSLRLGVFFPFYSLWPRARDSLPTPKPKKGK